ncbi:TIGR04376 family protein [Laspinema sp. D1]|uniref:TIGR04376 family protein n=1 Tax=Laspinema palackyanum D2a TaxID=2953684 RepID=A0ABT2MSW0_9CYAN|nr:TIGR04376 family protein [Laspinema sp. D2b]MCT7966517.1 TIGR04376 family protein [Laspinema sp. D2a]
MGLFEDMSRFLETRLEEFMRNNPHLELQVLEEQLREQEEDTLKLILELQRKEKQLQDSILSTAQEIQLWHDRVSKAKSANREDLVRAAQEREASLLREGNQFWGQMQGVKERIEKAKELYRQIQVRRREVKAKSVEAEAARAQTKTQTSWDTGWNKSYNRSFSSGADPLDQEFRRWEADEELERLKRNMKR